MNDKIRWLRISYWAGAIGDFYFAIIALSQSKMEVPAYCHPMGLFSAVAFSWGCMLLLADREPLERKWILLPTILVGSMLLLAVIYSMYTGAIDVGSNVLNLILFPIVITLWSFSYYNARDKEDAVRVGLRETG